MHIKHFGAIRNLYTDYKECDSIKIEPIIALKMSENNITNFNLSYFFF